MFPPYYHIVSIHPPHLQPVCDLVVFNTFEMQMYSRNPTMQRRVLVLMYLNGCRGAVLVPINRLLLANTKLRGVLREILLWSIGELNYFDRHTFVIPLCDLYSLCLTFTSDWVCHGRGSSNDSACMDFDIILINLIFADLHTMTANAVGLLTTWVRSM